MDTILKTTENVKTSAPVFERRPKFFTYYLALAVLRSPRKHAAAILREVGQIPTIPFQQGDLTTLEKVAEFYGLPEWYLNGVRLCLPEEYPVFRTEVDKHLFKIPWVSVDKSLAESGVRASVSRASGGRKKFISFYDDPNNPTIFELNHTERNWWDPNLVLAIGVLVGKRKKYHSPRAVRAYERVYASHYADKARDLWDKCHEKPAAPEQPALPVPDPTAVDCPRSVAELLSTLIQTMVKESVEQVVREMSSAAPVQK